LELKAYNLVIVASHLCEVKFMFEEEEGEEDEEDEEDW